uniref:G2/mitotic-specific cyclin-B3 n=1 Tax=Plectus sambesii TaxID=2011161 RepID=A0A914W1X0_9BILA
MRTRLQTRQENATVPNANKRNALENPSQPPKKRQALCDLSNAISNVVIDSSKKALGVPTQKAHQLQQQKPTKRAPRRSSHPHSGSEERNDDSLSSSVDSSVASTKSIRVSSQIGGSSSSSSASPESSLSESPAINTGSKGTVDEEDPCPGYDYDKENAHDQFSVPSYAQDIFRYYKSREAQFKVTDYLPQQPNVSKHMRAVLADWMVEVQENFELNHETLYQAVKLTDLYLARVPGVSKDELQLIASTAIFISSKFDERQPPLIDDFLYICEDAYDRDQLIAMERTMLKTVGFDIGTPLSYRFLRRYAKTSKADMGTLTLARYVLESSLMFYEFQGVSDSLLGAAAFLLALRMKKVGDWTPIHQKYSGFSKEQVEPLMWKLNHMLKMRARIYEKLTTVYTKYSHEVFFEVAKTPLLPGGPDETDPIGPPVGL